MESKTPKKQATASSERTHSCNQVVDHHHKTAQTTKMYCEVGRKAARPKQDVSSYHAEEMILCGQCFDESAKKGDRPGAKERNNLGGKYTWGIDTGWCR
jgi:hypothetical protein